MSKKKIVIFISGRGSNMDAIIHETESGILKDCAEISMVFSNNPKAAGLKKAQKKGIKTCSIDSRGKKREYYDNEVIELLSKFKFDYIVLAGYMRILSEKFVKTYAKRIINIHPADTKLHQGLHAYEWAFENKLKETKITVHYVDIGVDTGEIISQARVDLRNANTLEEIEKRGLAVEHKLYPETLYTLFKQK
jgi:phosphoribosylglycinamide formyltransferase-1